MGFRRKAKVDVNQPDIVKELRALGITVQILSMVGQGCPDILCGYKGRNWLFEIKEQEAVPSAQRLTEHEEKWHQQWRGQVHVILNGSQAWNIIQRDLLAVA